VLILANVLGLAWAGIFAVLAMSAGTALAVAALAMLAVNARSWASSIATSKGSRFRILGDIVAFGGGLVVMLLGIWLVAATLAPQHPLGLS
jgi:nickel/cobalt exporter